MVTDAVNTLLDEVTHDRTHQIRQTFDRATQKLIDNLKSDLNWRRRPITSKPG